MAAGEPAGLRRFEVAAARVERWVAGFEERHGPARRSGALILTAADGSVARLTPFVANDRYAVSLASWAAHPPSVALLLVRRGGYAVGLADRDALVAHKVGTRYVQSRTAAGGWSQQRFARRRANQADALVDAVSGHMLAVLGGKRPQALVVGGDRGLVAEVLADPRLARLTALPRRELFDLRDPRRSVLADALVRGRSVRVELRETAPHGTSEPYPWPGERPQPR